jgi:uncharacterized protein (DUF342 family)
MVFMCDIRSFVVCDSKSSDAVDSTDVDIENDEKKESIDYINELQAELKQFKKKLRKAEDLLNELRSFHDVMKKELKKKKKSRQKNKE